MTYLLEVRDLAVSFHTDEGTFRAVDGVSFEIKQGSTLALVGESGCGKSVTALSIMRLISKPGRMESGSILFSGKDLLSLPEKQMREVRGQQISMIFQEPMTSLNPVYTVGSQITEAIHVHEKVSRKAARDRAIAMLRSVGIPSPETRIDAYPHELSGGMRQRVMIAIALCCHPKLLIADEPTTALDVTIQAQILELLGSLQKEMGMTVLLITHDLGVVNEFVDEVVVMYAGKVVERAMTRDIFESPQHPYTRGLLASVPKMNEQGRRLRAIPGSVPDLRRLPPGCRFRDRCDSAIERCSSSHPPLVDNDTHRKVACYVASQKENEL